MTSLYASRAGRRSPPPQPSRYERPPKRVAPGATSRPSRTTGPSAVSRASWMRAFRRPGSERLLLGPSTATPACGFRAVSRIETQLKDDERFDNDRRAPDNRRAGASDHESGDDRRRTNRRHTTTERFIPADVVRVSGMVTNPTSSVSCPACQGNLMLGPPMERSGTVARRVECVDCHRVAMVQAKG